MPGRYEYRLYEGTFPTLQQSDAPLLIAIFRWLDAALTGLTIDSRTPLQQQLSSFVANSSFFQLPLPIMQTVVDLANQLIAQVPHDLVLPGIDQELVSGDIQNPNDPFGLTKISLRVIMRGDWQVVFGEETLGLIPRTASPFDPATKWLRFRASLETIKLLSLGLDVQIKAPIGGWNSIAQFGVADGSYLSGVHADVSLQPIIGIGPYELVAGSGQKFHGFSFTAAGLDLSNEHAQVDLINAPIGWILDAINYLCTHLYGGLNIYQAIAKRVLDQAQAQLLALVPANPPPLLDLPSEEVYGEALGIPPAQRVTVDYNQTYDVIGPENQPRPRTLSWQGAGPLFIPPPVFADGSVGILANPNWWQDWRARLVDSIRIDQLIGYDPRIGGTVPAVDLSAFSPAVITQTVEALARRQFLARDLAAMHLLRQGVPAAVVGGLSWREVDLAAGSLQVRTVTGTTTYKLSADSAGALGQFGKPATGGSVFVTSDGTPLGLTGITGLASSYRLILGLGGNIQFPPPPGPAPGPPSALPDTIPPPLSQLSPLAVLGYAVDAFVPLEQFALLGQAGGFNLALAGLDSAAFAAVYPPLSGHGTFAMTMLGSPGTPSVDFGTGGLPGLRLPNTAISLELSGPGQQPLTLTASLDIELTPAFLQCSDCARGRGAAFLDLVRDILCLADLGLLQLSSDRTRVLNCVLYLYAMTLQPTGQVAEQGVSVNSTGTFPAPTAAGQLPGLLGQLLPKLVSQIEPVPVLFDYFHLVPDTVRSSANQQVIAHDGWCTVLIPLLPP